VHAKLNDPAWIPARDRCQLCQGAIDDVTINNEEQKLPSWVSVTRGESEWASFVDFAPVAENFRDFLNHTLVEQERVLKHPLFVIYVCGLDHFNKCSDVRKMAELDNVIPAIVFRSGNDEQMISSVCKSSKIIYVPLTGDRKKMVDVSSTQIRQYFQNPSSSNRNIKKYIYPNVHEYMTKKYSQ
jgi:nicotinic acid mononucleotide adenylyltransferase